MWLRYIFAKLLLGYHKLNWLICNPAQHTTQNAHTSKRKQSVCSLSWPHTYLKKYFFIFSYKNDKTHDRCFVSNPVSVKWLVQLISNGETFSRLWFECSVWQQQKAFHIKNTTFSSLECVNTKYCPVRFSRQAFPAVLFKAPFVIIQQCKRSVVLEGRKDKKWTNYQTLECEHAPVGSQSK